MLFGKIVVIKRNGTDGAHFPLTATSCLFGRSNECDIRIQLPTVSKEHCRVDVNSDAQVFVTNLSQTNPTQVNGKTVMSVAQVEHCDVFTISDRSFRFEFAPDSKHHPRNNKIQTKILTPKAKAPIPVSAKSTSPLTPRSDNKHLKSPKSKTPVKPKASPVSSVKKTKSQTATSSSNTPSPKASFLKENEPMSTGKHSASPRLLPAKSLPAQLSGGDGLSSSVRRKSMPLGSPYHPPKGKLRSSLSELRRRTMPVKESNEEASPKSSKRSHEVKTPSPAKLKTPAGTPSSRSGKKRKSSNYELPSAKRKRVSFGPSLSPEQFDKTLPPSTPMRKGSAPGRKSEPVILEESTMKTPVKRKSVAKMNSAIAEESPQSVTKEVKSSPKTKGTSPQKNSASSPVIHPITPVSGKKTPKIVSSKASKQSTPVGSPQKRGLTSASKSPARTPKAVTSPVQTPKSAKSSEQTSTATAFTIETPGTSSKSPARMAKATKSPARTPKITASPIKSPKSTKSPPRTSKTTKSPTMTKTSPMQTPKSATSPRKTLTATKSPARTPKLTTSPAKTPKSVKSPVRVSTVTLSPAKTPNTSMSPSRSKTPASPLQTPKSSRTPKATKSPAKTPKSVTSPVQAPMAALSPAKTPKATKSPAGTPKPPISGKTPKPTSPVQSPKSITSPATKLTIKSPTRTSKSVTSPATKLTIKSPTRTSKTGPSPTKTPKMIKSPATSKSPAKTPAAMIPATSPKSTSKSPSRTPKTAKSSTVASASKSPTRTPKAAATSPIQTPETASRSTAKNSKDAVGKSPTRTTVANSLAETPKTAISPTRTIKVAKSPARTPKAAKSPTRTPKVAKSPTRTPKEAKSPTRTPKVAKSPTITPKAAKSPTRTPKVAKSPTITPKAAKSPTRTPKSAKSTLTTPSTQIAVTPKSLKRSAVKINSSRLSSVKKAKLSHSVEKVIGPPADLNKIVALRAIHGHASISKKTPGRHTSAKKMLRKTPLKLWSDIVKSGVAVQGVARRTTTARPIKVLKKKKVTKQIIAKMAKTPRAVARARAPTTGHVASPATLLVGKMIATRVKTPKRLPKKGRKTSIKVSSRSHGKTSFGGLAEMFRTPSPKKSTPRSTTKQGKSTKTQSLSPSVGGTPHSLYADIPDTPNGPGEMMVSPLSTERKKKSTTPSLVGVRDLYKSAKPKSISKTPSLVGVRDLYKRAKTKSSIDVSGVKRMFSTPKTKRAAKDVNYDGLRRIMKTPKAKNVPSSPAGLEDLFKTPVEKSNTPRKRQSVPAVESVKKKIKTAETFASPANPEATLVSTSPEVRSVKKTRGRKSKLVTVSPMARAVSQNVRTVSAKVVDIQISVTPKKAAARGRRGKLAAVEVDPVSEIQATVEKMSTPNVECTRKSRTALKSLASPAKAKTPLKKSVTRKGRGQKAKHVENKMSPTDEADAPEEKKKVAVSKRIGQKVKTPLPSPVKTVSPEKKPTTPKGRTRRGQKQASPVKKLATPKVTRRGKVTQSKASPVVKAVLKQALPGADVLTPQKKQATPKRQTRRGKAVLSKSSPVVKDDKTSPKPLGRRGNAVLSKSSPVVKDDKTSPKPLGRRGNAVLSKSSPVVKDDRALEEKTSPKPLGRRAKKPVQAKHAKTPEKKSVSPNQLRSKLTVKSLEVVKDSLIIETSPKNPATPKGRSRRGKSGSSSSEAVVTKTVETMQPKKMATPKGRGRRGKTVVSISSPLAKVEKTPKSIQKHVSAKMSPLKTRIKCTMTAKSPAKTTVKTLKRPAENLLDVAAPSPKKSKIKGGIAKLKTPLKVSAKGPKRSTRKALVSITPLKEPVDIISAKKTKTTRGKPNVKSPSPVKKDSVVNKVKKTAVSKKRPSPQKATPVKRVTRSRR